MNTLILSFLIVLAWSPVETTGQAGYKVFSRNPACSEAYDYENPIWSDRNTTIAGIRIDGDATCFVVRFYDDTGKESEDSEEVCYYPKPCDMDHNGICDGRDMAIFASEFRAR